jgi:hypothetical protein
LIGINRCRSVDGDDDVAVDPAGFDRLMGFGNPPSGKRAATEWESFPARSQVLRAAMARRRISGGWL